ncbi:Glycosyl transferase family 39 [Planctomycetales bacterium 10988]|nr:Glycosyl transferase family 39 [Planctomycetales bacterium 10988]
MKQLAIHQLAILALSGLMFFLNLGGPELFDEDEPKNAGCGVEMLERGDWIVPVFNGHLRPEKPVFLYWVMILAYNLFGINEFAARAGSAFLAMGTVLMVYHLGRILFDAKTGLWSSIILCSTLMYTALARAATPDATLIFFTTGSMLAFVWGVSKTGLWQGVQKVESSSTYPWKLWVPQGILVYFIMFAAMSCAVLTKGPIGVLLPSCVVGFFVLNCGYHWKCTEGLIEKPQTYLERLLSIVQWYFSPRSLWEATFSLRPFILVLCLSCIALPWYIAVSLRTDGAWLSGFLGTHNVGRFLEPMENHQGPVFYYAITILLGFGPWSLFLIGAIGSFYQQLKSNHEKYHSFMFVASWVSVWFIFFSLAATKLPNYIVPIYPSLALGTGWYLKNALTDMSEKMVWSVRWSPAAYLLLGSTLVIALPVASYFFLPQAMLIGLVGVVPILGGITLLFALNHHQERIFTILATTAVVFTFGMLGIVADVVSKYQNAPSLGKLTWENQIQKLPLATYHYSSPNLVFYSQKPVFHLQTKEAISEYFQQNPQGILVTRDDRLEEIQAFLPEDVEVKDQQKRFLRRHELVVLSKSLTPEMATLPEQSNLK